MKHVLLLASAAPMALFAAFASTPALAQTATPQEQQQAVQPDAGVDEQAPVAQERATRSAQGRSPGTQATENLGDDSNAQVAD